MCNARWRDVGAWSIDLRDDEEANDRFRGAAQNCVAAIERLLRGPPSRCSFRASRPGVAEQGQVGTRPAEAAARPVRRQDRVIDHTYWPERRQWSSSVDRSRVTRQPQERRRCAARRGWPVAAAQRIPQTKGREPSTPAGSVGMWLGSGSQTSAGTIWANSHRNHPARGRGAQRKASAEAHYGLLARPV